MKNQVLTSWAVKNILPISFIFSTVSFVNAQNNSKPNILWFVIEDTSPQNIGCYGSSAVHTPNIDKLAKEGIRFNNAYSTGTVCSPSRSTIITGVRTYKSGTGHHRSGYPIPSFIKGFPYYLKQAGYYTSNNPKTDYNTSMEPTIIKNSWNESSTSAGWWKRKPGQPFFAVFNYADSHQSRTMTDPYDTYVKNVLDVLPTNLQVGEKDFVMPPYLADNADMRKEYARMYNGISLADYNIGKTLKRLEDEGLKDSTIIFFYADHGQGMPRIKTNGIGQSYKVPFVIWFPEMYKHLSPFGTGGVVTSEQISFADLAPTVLSLAGIQSPDYFDGRPFLGSLRKAATEYMFVSNDRTDNDLNINRTVIKDSLVYIRNFTPFQPEQRYINYFMISEICQLMYEDYIGNKLTPNQAFVFDKRRPECLFNLGTDKWEMNNLIDDPKYAAEIAKMRAAMEQNILQSKDIMLISEYEYLRLPSNLTPYEYRLTSDYKINEIWEAASLSGFSGEEIKQKQLKLLDHSNRMVRYWAAIGLRSQKNLTSSDLGIMIAHLNDDYSPAKIYLAAAIYESNKSEAAKEIIKQYSLSSDPELSLIVLDNIQNMTSFKDFGDLIATVYANTKGQEGVTKIFSSANVLMYRLKAANFVFSYGTATIPQKVLANFETPLNIESSFGVSFDVTQNPSISDIDKTEHCGRIKRSTSNWYELIDIPCNFSIKTGEVAYVHIMVNYPARPDIILRPNKMGNEINIRAINEYTDFGKWQDLVFVISGGNAGLDVTNLRYIGDSGFQNTPAGFVLNNTNKIGYIDEIIVNSDPSPRSSITSFLPLKVNKDYYLNSFGQSIKYKSISGQPKKVVIFDITGKLLFSAREAEFKFQVPKSGLYIVRVDSGAEKIFVM